MTPELIERIVEHINAFHDWLIENKPQEMKSGYMLSPGAILNAYREGDLSFDGAVKALERWKDLT